VLGLSTVLCLSCTVQAAVGLRKHIVKHGVLHRDAWTVDRHHLQIHLNRTEVLIIAWAIITGIWSLFVEGSYAVFHTLVEADKLWVRLLNIHISYTYTSEGIRHSRTIIYSLMTAL
jgi:hypothetical protein